MKSFITNGLYRLKPAVCEAGSKILHNLHNLLSLLVFCRLGVVEVLSLREQILLNVHRRELLNQGDGDLIEGQAIAGQR
jgi:hypothetical protein